jgi:4-hydroxy-3-polyprenylbenzoate decarboxylase
MAYENLREFIKVLEKHRELKRVSVPVSSDQEITEITDRVSKAGGPALLFENVDGGKVPVLINALGSRRRMELALEVESVDAVAARLTEWLDFKSPTGLLEKVKMLPKLAELGKYFPKVVKSGPCQEVVKREGEFSLFDFPILKCWESDGGRFITLPMVFTRNPRTGARNCGMYRMQVYDWHALADSQARRGAPPRLGAEGCRADGGRRRHRCRADHDLRRDSAAAGRSRRNDFCEFPAREAD